MNLLHWHEESNRLYQKCWKIMKEKPNTNNSKKVANEYFNGLQVKILLCHNLS
jgi:hypothetical protein